ncbi:uncharacterized protein LOC109860456 [Pseudomyrmex gracilis]|uniref:uncharacterized protein LOC109860456 n=1 Tax=Pseudomyrmex gracilis TaxID=219809 RepID=UPI000994C7CB|nr:uncharacterized protein LOC109860456 [Pseudomyrmex gracilis]
MYQIDTSQVQAPKNIIVDCDAGIDDALALLLFLPHHKAKTINIKAITCVNGNTGVNNVVKNVFRTLQVCEVSDIPVYRGAYSSLLDTPNATQTASEQYHGTDGFGDAYTDETDTSELQKEHAVYALHKITSENPNNVSVVCLGPLTNIALTIKMYPEFLDNVKEFWMMGGNLAGKGNVTAQAEFNFYADPESVHVVLNRNVKPLWLLPWETCLKSDISHEWRKDEIGKIDHPFVRMMNQIEDARRARTKKRFANYIMCDAFLAAIVLFPQVAKTVVSWHADIELFGTKTRGQVVLDHLFTNKPNVNLIQEFCSESFKKTLIDAVRLLTSSTVSL